jgi:hypothetical protein
MGFAYIQEGFCDVLGFNRVDCSEVFKDGKYLNVHELIWFGDTTEDPVKSNLHGV